MNNYRNYKLQFKNLEIEESYMKKSIEECRLLIKIYLAMKFGLGLINMILQLKYYNSNEFRSSLYAIITYSTSLCFVFICKQHLQLIINAIQVNNCKLIIFQIITPIVFIFFLIEPSQQLNKLSFSYYFGAYKTLNAITLFFIGPKFIQSTFCFLCAIILYSSQFEPISIYYSASNFFLGTIWIISLKYLVEKSKREQFGLMKENIHWNYVVEKILQSWIIVVGHYKSINQIYMQNANEHFKQSCQIKDDADFRKFVRSVRIKKQHLDHQDRMDKKEKLTLEILLRNVLIENNPLLEKPSNNTFHQQYVGKRNEELFHQKTIRYNIKLVKGINYIILVIDSQDNKERKLREKLQTVIKEYQQTILKVEIPLQRGFAFLFHLFKNYSLSSKKQEKTKFLENFLSDKLIAINYLYNKKLILQSFYKSECNEFKLKESRFNILLILRQIADLLRQFYFISLIDRNQIIIKIISAGNSLWIIQDKQKLIQLFLNLIYNEIHHNNSQYKHLAIHLITNQNNILNIVFESNGSINHQINIQKNLKSYKINIRGSEIIQVINQPIFKKFILQERKHGLLLVRIISAYLGPNSKLKLNQTSEGLKISFQIFQNLNKIFF